LIVTEGYFDAIALAINGYESSVASMGTSLSVEQINQLWQISNQPLLCYDGDTAGKNAAIRVIELIFPILKPSFSMNFLFLPGAMDPDDLLKNHGSDALNPLIASSVSLIDLFWDKYMSLSDYGTPEGRAKIELNMMNMISKIHDTEVKKHYKFEISSKLSAYWKSKSYESNKIFFIKKKSNLPSEELISKSNKKRIPDNISKAEALYLSTIISYPELIGGHLDEIASIKFHNKSIGLINKEIIDFIVSNRIKNEQSTLVKEYLNENGFLKILDDVSNFDFDKIYDFLNKQQELSKMEGKFKNILIEVNKYQLTKELEEAKLNYSGSPTEENAMKLEDLKYRIQKIRSDTNMSPSDNQKNKKGFDKWYEENKSRLQKKEPI
jgi:DNA primase